MAVVLVGEDGEEVGRFEYTAAGKPKAIDTAAGPFTRRKFAAPSAAAQLVLPENVVLKVSCQFVIQDPNGSRRSLRPGSLSTRDQDLNGNRRSLRPGSLSTRQFTNACSLYQFPSPTRFLILA